jgi:hypothetical protein
MSRILLLLFLKLVNLVRNELVLITLDRMLIFLSIYKFKRKRTYVLINIIIIIRCPMYFRETIEKFYMILL